MFRYPLKHRETNDPHSQPQGKPCVHLSLKSPKDSSNITQRLICPKERTSDPKYSHIVKLDRLEITMTGMVLRCSECLAAILGELQHAAAAIPHRPAPHLIRLEGSLDFGSTSMFKQVLPVLSTSGLLSYCCHYLISVFQLLWARVGWHR